MMHTPKVAMPFLQLFQAIGKLPGFVRKEREVVILVTGTKYQAAYELYAHRRIAVETAGLSQAEVDDICE